MADKKWLLEKHSAAFASESESKSCQSFSNLHKKVSSSFDASEIDSLLEKTLVKDIEISEPLTRCERDILQLIVSGLTNREIAGKRCRAQRTIEYHRNRIMRKLKTHNVAGLIKRAVSMGIT